LRFLFCTIALHGFVYPAIGIALQLQRRGHEVAFVTGPDFRAVIEEHGLRFIPFTREERSTFSMRTAGHPFALGLQVAHIEHALARFPAQALLTSEMALGSLIAAERCGLPVAVLGLAASLLPDDEHKLFAPTTKAERESAFRYMQMTQLYRQVRTIYGLPDYSEDLKHTPLLGDLFLLQSIPELQVPGQVLPERVRLVGSCLWEPSLHDEGLQRWLATKMGEEPLVYIQLGRFFGNPCFWPMLSAVLRKRPVRAVIAAGRTDIELGEIPERWLLQRHVPQGPVLRCARAVITNGHTTPVLGALSTGIPSLLLPSGSGTDETAEVCVRAGVALREDPPSLDAGILERAVDRLLADSQLLQAARRIQRAFARYDGPRLAADHLEQLALAARPTGNGDVPAAALGMGRR